MVLSESHVFIFFMVSMRTIQKYLFTEYFMLYWCQHIHRPSIKPDLCNCSKYFICMLTKRQQCGIKTFPPANNSAGFLKGFHFALSKLSNTGCWLSFYWNGMCPLSFFSLATLPRNSAALTQYIPIFSCTEVHSCACTPAGPSRKLQRFTHRVWSSTSGSILYTIGLIISLGSQSTICLLQIKCIIGKP